VVVINEREHPHFPCLGHVSVGLGDEVCVPFRLPGVEDIEVFPEVDVVFRARECLELSELESNEAFYTIVCVC